MSERVSEIKRGGLVGGPDDDLKWAEIFKACETVGGTEWYVVEYDGGSMEKAQKTIETLRSWGKCGKVEKASGAGKHCARGRQRAAGYHPWFAKPG